MPDILNPDVCACSKEEPLNGYKQVADDIRCDGDTHKEDRESLEQTQSNSIILSITHTISLQSALLWLQILIVKLISVHPGTISFHSLSFSFF